MWTRREEGEKERGGGEGWERGGGKGGREEEREKGG